MLWKFLFPPFHLKIKLLKITLPNDSKDLVSSQSLLSNFSQNTTPSFEINDSLHGSRASLNDEMEVQEASSSAP